MAGDVNPCTAFLVLTASAAAAFGPNFNFYHKVKGLIKEVRGPAGLAAEIGCDTEAVKHTLEAYADAANAGR